MKVTDYEEKQKEFVKLWKKQTLNQKQIAEVLNVSEQTICRWVKSIKAEFEQLKETRKNLITRFNQALADPNTTSTDIHNYSTALSVLTKQINNTGQFQ